MASAPTLQSVLADLSANPPTALLELAKRLESVALSEESAIKIYLFIRKLSDKHNLDIDFPDDEEDPQERLNYVCESIKEERARLLEAAVSLE
jgi:hypothetical protein